jgi:uncharacterized membrane protein
MDSEENIMEQSSEPTFAKQISKGRLEFLFDGIFAIAMTLLVLELKVPELQDHHSPHELGVALLHNRRIFLSYIISFLILSGFWIGHNKLYAKLTRITKAVVFIHIWMLAWAAFVPFCAHLIGRYPGNQLALLIYLAMVFAYTLGLLALIITAERQNLFDPAIPAGDVRKLRRGFMRPLIAMLLFALYIIFILPVMK